MCACSMGSCCHSNPMCESAHVSWVNWREGGRVDSLTGEKTNWEWNCKTINRLHSGESPCVCDK